MVDIQHRDGSIFNKRPFNVRYDEPRIRALLDAKAAATSFDDYKKKLAELGIELPSHITELYESITPSRLLRPRGHE